MGIGQARQITNCPTFPLHHRRHNCLPDIFFAIAAAAAAEEKQQECNKIIIFQLTNYLRCFVDAGHVNSLLLSFQEVPRYLHSAQSRVDALLLLPVDVCIWDGGTSLGVLAKIRRLRKRNLMNEIREELVAISGGCCCCDQILQTDAFVRSSIFARHVQRKRPTSPLLQLIVPMQFCTFWSINLLAKKHLSSSSSLAEARNKKLSVYAIIGLSCLFKKLPKMGNTR